MVMCARGHGIYSIEWFLDLYGENLESQLGQDGGEKVEMNDIFSSGKSELRVLFERAKIVIVF